MNKKKTQHAYDNTVTFLEQKVSGALEILESIAEKIEHWLRVDYYLNKINGRYW